MAVEGRGARLGVPEPAEAVLRPRHEASAVPRADAGRARRGRRARGRAQRFAERIRRLSRRLRAARRHRRLRVADDRRADREPAPRADRDVPGRRPAGRARALAPARSGRDREHQPQGMVGHRARVRGHRRGLLRGIQRAGRRREDRHRHVDRLAIAACDGAEPRRVAVGELRVGHAQHELRLQRDHERHALEEGQPRPQHGADEEGGGADEEGSQDHVQGHVGGRERGPVGPRHLQPERDRRDAHRLLPARAEVEGRPAPLRAADDVRHRHPESGLEHRHAGRGREGAGRADQHAVHVRPAAVGDHLQRATPPIRT